MTYVYLKITVKQHFKCLNDFCQCSSTVKPEMREHLGTSLMSSSLRFLFPKWFLSCRALCEYKVMIISRLMKWGLAHTPNLARKCHRLQTMLFTLVEMCILWQYVIQNYRNISSMIGLCQRSPKLKYTFYEFAKMPTFYILNSKTV